ncbi:hypothetical protein HKD37_19G053968 [Glycine soja]
MSYRLHLNSCEIEQLKKHSSDEVQELCLFEINTTAGNIFSMCRNVGNKEEWTPFSQTPGVTMISNNHSGSEAQKGNLNEVIKIRRRYI